MFRSFSLSVNKVFKVKYTHLNYDIVCFYKAVLLGDSIINNTKIVMFPIDLLLEIKAL